MLNYFILHQTKKNLKNGNKKNCLYMYNSWTDPRESKKRGLLDGQI